MNDSPPDPVPESIAASLARSEVQIAAGQIVPFEPVLDRLRSSIARMQADEKLKAMPPKQWLRLALKRKPDLTD